MSTVVLVCQVNELAYLTIRGRMVAGVAANAVRDAVLRATPHFGLLVVNLRDVEKIDAAGLSALLFAYSTAQSVGARFRLTAIPLRIYQLLAIAYLDTILVLPDDQYSREPRR